ncbi:MAG: hypothetical protein COU28_02705 [Candidatus Magasanikbacteria bacterium CG10_big_fil_rev_8_21_14_0_10_36_16]|uniref:LysM domain-containing protein n=1 Tax=Candidatus Magasanikbacteria bacterium CG10_big_fil_rev_8_21_14_0_10_36_16 TaxID=1974645 RepID=A0A2H0TYD7_9BACT|nr:MAG: hypothetical protein COU28_02705 [Candidatus Magasanikbacteria bacterium CG10_big_fil_rev_8_21_14_0_10_36_16]
MDKKFYKVFLYFLKGLIYLKRSVFWLFGFGWKFLLFINNIYKSTLGFVLFKALFYTKKYFNKLKFFQHESKIEFFGRRGTLQVLFFVVFFAIMIPHTQLYSKSFGEVSGKNSLLYQVIGHGNQDFTEEEVLILNTATTNVTNSSDWKAGAVSTEDAKSVINTTGDLGSVTVGGTAVTKPTIIPGSEQNKTTSSGAQIVKTSRTETVNYTVQVGDVIGEIAKRFNINISTILWANNLTARSYIKPNQVLAILPVDGVTHKVVKGDTVSKIAKLYDADSTQIVKFNKLEKDGADIVVGETLVVPGGEKETVVSISKPTSIVTRPSSFNNVVPVSSVATPAGSGYLWPTDARIITQYFGLTHNALDISGGGSGTRVYATKAGKVITSQCGWNGGYGCYIKIDHGNGVVSLYGHSSKLLVNVGDYVTQGQNIMLMGSTGHSTGPHVHFEILVNGKNVNPLSYVRKP